MLLWLLAAGLFSIGSNRKANAEASGSDLSPTFVYI
jgi:hypothetical protein